MVEGPSVVVTCLPALGTLMTPLLRDQNSRQRGVVAPLPQISDMSQLGAALEA
jgi:hypothetical protein